eukprot:TRINITY_DN3866_c0_g1_i2.p1 TRINITY_DN3866_c0_g1~~TRINITY_DN3866_c0_g1_i2.p1  ORF type:complete len:516 (-),score=99.54 TRINITY_DN3866_c0_g1_i2:23-1570(-)
MCKAIVCAIVIVIIAFIVSNLYYTKIIDTQFGPLKGSVFIVDGIISYYSIPFALPPIEDLRFKPPVDWSTPWSKVRDATKNGIGPPKPCPQAGLLSKVSGSEDCLYLNVYTPPEKYLTQPLPVMVWLFGGSFDSGDSWAGGLYSGHNFIKKSMKKNPVIFVTLNYRVNSFGFLALDQLKDESGTTGNYGIQDQRSALTWIKSNIHSFGGDPNQITLFGQSAGAMSTWIHVTNPHSKGLFNSIISQSGICEARGYLDAKDRSKKVTNALGCTDPISILPCIRSKTIEEILEANTVLKNLTFSFGDKWRDSVMLGLPWYPVIDGEEIKVSPQKTLRDGNFDPISAIVGTTQNEFGLISPGIDVSEGETVAEVLEPFFPSNLVGIIAEKYPCDGCNPKDTKQSAINALNDAYWHCPNLYNTNYLAQKNENVYQYLWRYEGLLGLLGWGAFHGVDIPVVFSNPPPLFAVKFYQSVNEYWSSFASNSIPSSVKDWPVFTFPFNISISVEKSFVRVHFYIS